MPAEYPCLGNPRPSLQPIPVCRALTILAEPLVVPRAVLGLGSWLHVKEEAVFVAAVTWKTRRALYISRSTRLTTSASPFGLPRSSLPWDRSPGLSSVCPSSLEDLCHSKRKFPSTIPRAQGGAGVFWRKYHGQSRASGWAPFSGTTLDVSP